MVNILVSLLLTFGQNKVQYRDLSWETAETNHFMIYFTKGGEGLVDFASPILENTYERLSRLFSIEFKEKVPVIIYASPNDFRETNIVLDLIEEGVGGFTEFYKSRVVVPFDGSYESFRHVLEHELTHVFEYRLFYSGIQGLAQEPFFNIPLYIMEGLSEYISVGWDSETEGFVKDLLINDMFPSLKELEYYGGYIVYKVGQAFYYFIYETYGEEKISEFLYALKFKKSLNKACLKVFGVSYESLSEKFSYYLKKKVYREFETYKYPPDVGKQITDHVKEGGFMNVGGAPSDDGTKIAFLSDRKGYTDLYLTSIYTQHKVKKVVSGEKFPSLENLHLLRPGICFSPDGRYIVFTSYGKGEEIINFYDTEKNRIIKSYSFKNFDGIYTPEFSSDGDKIVFAGVKDGKTDLYILNVSTGEIEERLTDDWFEDKDPVFIDNDRIVFVSDRNNENRYGSYAIFLYYLKDGTVRRITPYLGSISYPFVLEDSLYIFLYKERGISNLMAYDISVNKFYQITSFPTGIREVKFARETKDAVLSILWKGGYEIFYIDSKDILDRKEWKEIDLEEKSGHERLKLEDIEWKEYVSPFTIDWLGGAVEYAPEYGYFGSVVFQASDMLGNLRVQFFSDMTGGDLTVSNWALGIYYLPKRIDYFVQFYQYFPFYPYDSLLYSYERNLGFNLISLIPLNRFFRIEVGTGFNYIERYILYEYFADYYTYSKDYFIQLPFYSVFVWDRSFNFYYFGVRDGERAYLGLETGVLPELYLKYSFDARKYFRITPRSNFAMRFVFAGKEGSGRILPFWLGGPTTLRGYDLFEFVYPYIFLSSLELRVPFLDNLKLSFPLPLQLGNIRGVLFIDAGAGFNTVESMKKFRPIEEKDGSYKLKDLLFDYGFGFRWNLGYFDLKLDFAYKTDFTGLGGRPFIWLTFGRDF